MNLNHANLLKPQNLWTVVSQEFARFAQEFHQIKVSRFNVDRVRRPVLWRWQLGRVGRACRMDHIGMARDRYSLEWCAGLVGGLGVGIRQK